MEDIKKKEVKVPESVKKLVGSAKPKKGDASDIKDERLQYILSK